MGKIPGVKFEFGTPQKEKVPRVKFDFGPLNPKMPQWAPRMGKSPRIKI
jgi:hypothetical protein